MTIKFKDNSIQVKELLKEKGISFLTEASAELLSQTQRNIKVDTGQTKGSFKKIIDESEMKAIVGSDYMNAIYEEFGTGVYALEGDGRKTKWVYKDSNGDFHTTVGKKPKRALYNAFTDKEDMIKTIAKNKFGGIK